jgi:hypothetical protein
MEHLRVLTKLPKLAVLNLYDVPWAEDTFCTGLTLLAAALPRLRVLNAPTEVLVRTIPFIKHLSRSIQVAVVILNREKLLALADECRIFDLPVMHFSHQCMKI